MSPADFSILTFDFESDLFKEGAAGPGADRADFLSSDALPWCAGADTASFLEAVTARDGFVMAVGAAFGTMTAFFFMRRYALSVLNLQT